MSHRTGRLAPLAAAAVLAGAAVPAAGATINVSTTAGLEAAVAGAQNGDQIVLAPGTYQPAATLAITRNITLQGPAGTPGRTSPTARIEGRYVDGDSIDVIEVGSGRSVTIRNVTVTRTQRLAAGISVLGTLTLEGSTLTGNDGTAVWVVGTATLRNSTVAANTREGLEVEGTARLYSATVTGNARGGIANSALAGRTELTNTVVWGNGAAAGGSGRDCSATVEAASGSMDGDDSCGVDAGSTDPQLAPLSTFGGTTQTRAPLPGSPVIDAGTATGCPAADQRGAPRDDARCDVGAVEFAATAGDATAPVVTVPAPFTVPAVSGTGADATFTAAASDPEGTATTLTCTPPSGSRFPVGATVVDCTGTDAAGNAWAEGFRLTVTGAGVACQPEGRVTGRGPAAAAGAYAVFAAGYRDDVCGAVGADMVAYNPPGALAGSPEGLLAAGCRTDAFGVTDIPFDTATLGLLNGAAGAIGTCPGGFPDPADAQASVMTVPVGAGAVALGVNLPASACTGGPRPTSLSFTSAMVDALMDGRVPLWSDPALRAGGVNANLANCPVAVRRVVPAERSGTAQVVRSYLRRVDPSGPGCGSGQTWTALAAEAGGTTWPGGTGCSPVASAAGDAGVTAACTATAGSLCFGGLPDMAAASALVKPSVRNATDTAYAAPGVGSRANCAVGTLTVPGGTATGAVGLDPGDTWATDNAAGNRADVTQQGTAYPMCGLTFALVYRGTGSALVANPLARLNVHQRRTLSSHLAYALSSAGQDRLVVSRYAALPAALAATVRQGFLANYP